MAACGVGYGSAIEDQLLVGLRVFLGTRCGNQLFLQAALTAIQSPRGVFCIGLQVSGGAVSGHQVVFFTLSALATLSCRMSHAWQLNALWPSSHLENKANAMHCDQVGSSSPTKTHASHLMSISIVVLQKKLRLICRRCHNFLLCLFHISLSSLFHTVSTKQASGSLTKDNSPQKP